MKFVQARSYPSDASADAAFTAMTRTIDRLDAHTMASRVNIDAPSRQPLVVLVYAEAALDQLITNGHWHGGERFDLEPAHAEAFLELARRREAEAGGEAVTEQTSYVDGTRLTAGGEIVPAVDEDDG